jgi:O-antigen/teichoic acid export membrane protein
LSNPDQQVVTTRQPLIQTESEILRARSFPVDQPEPVLVEKTTESMSARVFQKLLGADHGRVFKRLIPWVNKGGLAILDQGLISGSNFLTSVLLARWMAPAQYGAYAVAFGIYVLLSVVYQSLVLEPMAVFGGSSYRNCLRGYVGSLFWIHVVASLAILAILGTSAYAARGLAQSEGLAGALAGVTIASPCVLAFALARRGFYLDLSPAKAAAGAFVYSAVSVGALFVLYRRSLLSAFTAFLLMGLAALVTAIYLFIRLRSELPTGGVAPEVGTAWKRHWKYGRWALASSVAGWIPAYVYYPLLSSFGNMVHSGQLKALMNLTLPMEQTKAALGMLFLPYAARIQDQEGGSSSSSLAKRMTLVSLGGAVVYWALILPLQGPVFHFLYSGRYMEVAHLLPVIAFGSIVWSAAYGPAIALRAMKSPASVFVAFSLATGLSLLIGVPATWIFGLKGAIWGSNLADVLSLVFVVVVLRRKIASQSEEVQRLTPWGAATAQSLSGEISSE